MPAKDKPVAMPGLLSASEIDPDLILAVIKDETFGTDGLEIVVDGSPRNPSIVVQDGERLTRTTLGTLTNKFERHGVDATAPAVRTAFIEWLDTRPVADHSALAKGVAVLAWTSSRSAVSWRVAVPRPTGVVAEWIPMTTTSPETLATARRNAWERARSLTVTRLPTGDVTVWAYVVNPLLSTAILTQPETIAAGSPGEEIYVVFSPGRPVASGPISAAVRLTEESTEPHQMLALTDLDTIGWK